MDVIVLGGMKCGTTSLHGYLAEHPEVGVSAPKELDFFFGDEPGGPGNWWRGPDWYARRFPADPCVRVEASPGYTSPAHPDVAARMAEVVPEVRSIYLARDPLDRAVSQYLHHRRDGDEHRDLATALLDPASQYIARSRHHARLQPFLRVFSSDQVRIVEHRDLLERRRGTLRAVFAWIGVDPEHWSPTYDRELNAAAHGHPVVTAEVRACFHDAVADDVDRFRRTRQEHTLRPLSSPTG